MSLVVKAISDEGEGAMRNNMRRNCKEGIHNKGKGLRRNKSSEAVLHVCNDVLNNMFKCWWNGVGGGADGEVRNHIDKGVKVEGEY